MPIELKNVITQKLGFSKKLQQSVRLLQYSAIKLNQETQKILEQNPFLEIKNQSSEVEKSMPNLVTSNSPQDPSESKNTLQEIYSSDESLYEHLKWQLDTGDFTARERQIADYVIDAIDANGYFYADLKKFKSTIKLNPKPPIDEIVKILKKIQKFDPDGIAARSVQECLLLQLYTFTKQHPHKKLAITIVKNEYEALCNKNFSLIANRLNIDAELLNNILSTIRTLNPYPGATFDNTESIYTTPDLIVKKTKQYWQVFLYQDLYYHIKLKNNSEKLLQKVFNTADKSFIKTAYSEAKWFKKCIDNRNNVLLKVAQTIINKQTDFLEKGEMYINQLNLDTISKLTGLHVSTVSRAVSQKYIQTSYGVHELKYFFRHNALKQNNKDISSISVKHIMKQIISNENQFKPYSDEEIVGILKLKEINVSRRTIAKYRTSLNIASSSKRKLRKLK